jgi:DNA-binding transcriptional LysR family regulator
MDSISQIEALRRESIDAGFVLGYRDGEEGFENCKLHEQTLRLAVREDHPLAARKSVSLADLKNQPLLCIPRRSNPALYDSIIAALQAGGVIPRFVKEYTPGAIILSMVSLGVGLGLVLSETPWRIPAGVVLKPIRGLRSRLICIWSGAREAGPRYCNDSSIQFRRSRWGAGLPMQSEPLFCYRADSDGVPTTTKLGDRGTRSFRDTAGRRGL